MSVDPGEAEPLGSTRGYAEEVRRRHPGAYATECEDGFVDIVAPHYYGFLDPAVIAWAQTEEEAWENASGAFDLPSALPTENRG